MHEIPSLKYKYSDLEPHFDEPTMRLHHTKHHQAYVDKLNQALEKYPDLAAKPVEELLRALDQVPEDIRQAVRNHGGGHYNHSLFWTILAPQSGGPREETISRLDQFFGGVEKFKEQLKAAALGQFGSGWAWLTADRGRMKIVATPNQDSPLSTGATPLLGVDVWEHAYYLKYQNRRTDYLDAFFQIINWEQVETNLLAALAAK